MKKYKILYILSAVIILAGILTTVFLRINFDMEYQEMKKINLYLEKQANKEEILQIAGEVFENQKVLVSNVGTFGDMYEIRLKDFSEEQKNNFITKLNEKYGIEIKEETNITVTDIPHLQARDIVKPYILPASIVGGIVLVYMIIRYYKLGVGRVLIFTLAHTILVEAVYVSILAVARIPISFYTIPVGIILAAFTLMYIANHMEKEYQEIKNEQKGTGQNRSKMN